MECPFCAETIKDEAVVCKHCNRDLRVALPIIAEIQETVLELDRLQRQLDRANTSLALFDRPARFLFLNGGIYVLLPSLLLLAAHYLVTVAMNVSPLYLRIASVIIPMPFGMAAFALSKIGYRGAFGLGALTAAVSVTGMFAVVAYLDGTSMVPATLQTSFPRRLHRAGSRTLLPTEWPECWGSMSGRKQCGDGRGAFKT